MYICQEQQQKSVGRKEEYDSTKYVAQMVNNLPAVYVWLFETLMDYSPPGSSVHGVLQARILECVAMPSSKRSSWPRDRTHIFYVSYIGRWIIYH